MDARAIVFPLLLLASPVGAAETGSDSLREIVRKGCDLRKQNDVRLRDYTILRRIHKRQFDGDGKPKSDETYTIKTDTVDGVRASWMVERNDKPLSDHDRQREERKRRQTIAEHNKASGKDDFDLDDHFFKELPDALEFKLAGRDRIAGREVLVIDFWPRSGYKAKSIRTKIFEKCQGRVWLDARDYQVHKLMAELTDNVAFGWGLARVEKGSRYVLEQERLEDGAWVPKLESVRFGGRLMMMRVANGEVDTSFRVSPRQMALAESPSRRTAP